MTEEEREKLVDELQAINLKLDEMHSPDWLAGAAREPYEKDEVECWQRRRDEILRLLKNAA